MNYFAGLKADLISILAAAAGGGVAFSFDSENNEVEVFRENRALCVLYDVTVNIEHTYGISRTRSLSVRAGIFAKTAGDLDEVIDLVDKADGGSAGAVHYLQLSAVDYTARDGEFFTAFLTFSAHLDDVRTGAA